MIGIKSSPDREVLSGRVWDWAVNNYSNYIINKIKIYISDFTVSEWYGQPRVAPADDKVCKILDETKWVTNFVWRSINDFGSHKIMYAKSINAKSGSSSTAPFLDIYKSDLVKERTVSKNLKMKDIIYVKARKTLDVGGKLSEEYWGGNRTIYTDIQAMGSPINVNRIETHFIGPAMPALFIKDKDWPNGYYINISFKTSFYVYVTFSGRNTTYIE